MICHFDLDAFYASVAQRDDPSLRGVPLAVSGSSRRAVVLTASYEARPFGVHSAMPLYRALELCPRLVVVPPNFTAYRETSQRVFAIFADGARAVEGLSLDEAFVALPEPHAHVTSREGDTASTAAFDGAVAFAHRVRARRNFVRGEFGTPKSRRASRSVPLADPLAGELDRLHRETPHRTDDDLVFAHPHTGRPIDRSKLLKPVSSRQCSTRLPIVPCGTVFRARGPTSKP